MRKGAGTDKQTLLLHVCCAPCGAYVIECLSPRYEISLLFYNPNIEPQDEYEKRKNELTKLVLQGQDTLQSTLSILDCSYGNDVFAQAVKTMRDLPEGGERCTLCFRLRLEETARAARDNCFDIFATTLTVSPHKNAKLINQIGEEAAAMYGVSYLGSDFKKNDGYKRSVYLSKTYNLYRQDYCGCKSATL